MLIVFPLFRCYNQSCTAGGMSQNTMDTLTGKNCKNGSSFVKQSNVSWAASATIVDLIGLIETMDTSFWYYTIILAHTTMFYVCVDREYVEFKKEWSIRLYHLWCHHFKANYFTPPK